MVSIENLKLKVLEGREVSLEEALALSEAEDRKALHEAAGEITRHFGKPAFNPCSIINVRARKCERSSSVPPALITWGDWCRARLFRLWGCESAM